MIFTLPKLSCGLSMNIIYYKILSMITELQNLFMMVQDRDSY